jgi:hypothetical protein
VEEMREGGGQKDFLSKRAQRNDNELRNADKHKDARAVKKRRKVEALR